MWEVAYITEEMPAVFIVQRQGHTVHLSVLMSPIYYYIYTYITLN